MLPAVLTCLPAALLSIQARSSHLKQDRTSLSDNTRIHSCELIQMSYTVRELTGKIYRKMRNRYYALPFICYENLSAVLERYNLPRQPKVTAVWQYSFLVRIIVITLLHSRPCEPCRLFNGGSSKSCCGKQTHSLTPTHDKCHYKPTYLY